jgi:16S rRNA G1207 methylase RsmC
LGPLKAPLIAMDHYYTRKPGSVLKIRTANLKLKNGRIYKFKTPSGVFSFGKVDKATKILVEHAIVHGKKVLDLGCGYGVVGIVVKGEYPDSEVYMSDVNERAVEFARINAKDNNVDVTIKCGSFYDPWQEEKFDVILLNPPMAAGKAIVLRMIYESIKHLNEKGSLQVVAYHNKGGSYIKKAMQETFGNVEDICKEGGIRIYKSVRLKGA